MGPKKVFSEDRLSLFYGLGCALCFAIMASLVKHLSHSRGMDPSNLVFFRSAIHLVIAASVILYTREPLPRFPQRILLYRGVAGFLSLGCLFYTLTHIPIAISMMLSWCSPAFVIVFSALFLKETMPPRALGWAVLAFAGLLLLLDIFKLGGGDSTVHRAIPGFVVFVGLAGAALGASAYVAVRAAANRFGVNVITLYFSAVATLGSLFLVKLPLMQGSDSTVLVFTELLAMGAVAALAQYWMTQAYRFGKASLVSMYTLSSAAISAVLGWAFFDESLGPIQLLGLGVMLFSISRLAARPS